MVLVKWEKIIFGQYEVKKFKLFAYFKVDFIGKFVK